MTDTDFSAPDILESIRQVIGNYEPSQLKQMMKDMQKLYDLKTGSQT
jgi:hypothetical protein